MKQVKDWALRFIDDTYNTLGSNMYSSKEMQIIHTLKFWKELAKYHQMKIHSTDEIGKIIKLVRDE